MKVGIIRCTTDGRHVPRTTDFKAVKDKLAFEGVREIEVMALFPAEVVQGKKR